MTNKTLENIMHKPNLLCFPRTLGRLQALVCGVGLLWCSSAGAQNLLQNGDFDAAPLGPTNWTIIYLHGGPDCFEIKDRVTPYAYHNNSFYDAAFRPIDQKLAHACFTQTVTNLEAGYSYKLSVIMREDWWASPTDAKRDKFLVYTEIIGGQGTPTEDGRASVLAVATDQSNLDPPYTYPNDTWLTFTNQQTPDTSGNIEVRLHYNMVGYVDFDKCMEMSGMFDLVSLTR
jgi:hypothetical protein